VSFLEKVKEARAEFEAQVRDPSAAKLENALHGVEAISTAGLLDLVVDDTVHFARKASEPTISGPSRWRSASSVDRKSGHGSMRLEQAPRYRSRVALKAEIESFSKCPHTALHVRVQYPARCQNAGNQR